MTETQETRRPQRDNNVTTFNAMQEAVAVIRSKANQSFDFACTSDGEVVLSNPAAHPASGRPIIEAMNKAADGEYDVRMAFKMVASKLFEEDKRTLTRAHLGEQKVLNISPAPAV
jgi:hypothetical protein